MPIFFQQHHWLGINFSELGSVLDPNKVADSDFYESFYRTIKLTYPTYKDLPQDWRIKKDLDATLLSSLVEQGSKILSYGCGIGYLESGIIDKVGPFFVTDFSPVILHYRPDLSSYFLNLNEIFAHSFSHILLNQAVYAFDGDSITKLIVALSKLLSPTGKLIITFNEVENHQALKVRAFIQSFMIKKRIPQFLKYFFSLATQNNQKQGQGQGWGYLRTKKEMISLCNRCNFARVEFENHTNQSVIILSK